MKLTNAKVAAAKSLPGKRAKIGDGRGLWLVIGENGRKTWAYMYSIRGAHRYMGLGSIDFMSLDQARDTALQLRGQVKRGIDPWAVLQAEKAANAASPPVSAEPLTPRIPTFEDVAERCIKHRASGKGWSNPKNEPQWRGSLTAYVYPIFGAKPVNEVTTADILDALKPIWTEKPETAKRVRSRIGAVLAYAAAHDWRSDDDLTRARGKLDAVLGTRKAKGEDDEGHASLPYAEIAAFMPKLQAQPGFGARALEFAILTAARTGEVIAATWDEINLDTAVWSIPKGRMKARQFHDVPLSTAAVDLLRSLPRGVEDVHVFPSPTREKQPLSNMALLATLKRMKRTDITAHGFRATFRTWAADQTSYPHEIVEAALAHTEQAVVRSYQRGTYLDRRRPMMEEWATFCGGVVPADNVVPIKGAK